MRYAAALLGMVLCMAQGHAQSLDTRRAHSSLDEFRRAVHQDLESFRTQCMDEFVSFVRNPWKEFEESKPVPVPHEEPVPPVVMPDDDRVGPVEDKPVVIDEVIEPAPVKPQPTPVEPIEEVPVEVEKTVAFSFFGTPLTVRFDAAHKPVLHGVGENAVADGLSSMRPAHFDNLLIDCLALREQLKLSDWAYLLMLKTLADHVCGQGTNESALMLAWLYVQSGYKMRLATDGAVLYMLYASSHQIFEHSSYSIDGDNYYGVVELPARLHICQASYPKEQELSLQIMRQPLFAQDASAARTITSARYPDVQITVSVNKNLIDFYGTYPTSMVDGNFMTRWGMYANVPLDAAVKQQAYPALQAKIKGLSQAEAANYLLNMVQTGLTYEYDDKVWGHDRAFFAEESLYYPYCDCEDRSILFTRLVRDLLGLDCLLVYYPGHLATAIAFSDEVKGDYILLNGRKFVVADPTYIGASVGMTMPDMDNKGAKVIVLGHGQ